MREVSPEHRELISHKLVAIAEKLRKLYEASIPEARRYIHEMVDVSV